MVEGQDKCLCPRKFQWALANAAAQNPPKAQGEIQSWLVLTENDLQTSYKRERDVFGQFELENYVWNL